MTANMNVKARQKSKTGHVVLEALRRGGWVNRDSNAHDLISVLSVLIEELDVDIETYELCSVLPWHNDYTGEDKTLKLTGLLNTLSELGFVAHALNMRLCDLDVRLCPCLFVSDAGVGEQKHVMVVLRFDKAAGLYDVFDSKTQQYEKISVEDTPFGTAWIFMEEGNVQDALSDSVREASGYSWFRALMERFSGGLWQVIAVGAMLTFLSLAAPIFVMLVYDRVIGAHAPEALMPLLIGALLALCTEGVLRLVRAHLLSWYGARLDYIVGTQVFEHLLRMPVLFTERASVAAQISRIKAFDAVRAFFTGTAFLAMVELPFTLILIAIIAIIAGWLAIIPIIAAGFYALLVFVMRLRVRTSMRLTSKAASLKQEMMIETFEKMSGLRVGGLTSIWFSNFRDLSGKASLAGFNTGFLAAILETLSHGIYLLAGLSVVTMGVISIWAGSMSAGALIAVMILTWRVLAPMQILSNALPHYEQLKNAVEQINRLMNIETENTKANVTARLDDPKGDLNFKQVGLRYTKESDPVFTGVSFVARQGEMIAVTGGNGVGKSTVLKLINGLYHPQAGAIYIDGIDIRQMEAQHLRRQIAYVPQTPSVFNGTIAENLRFANPLADDERVRDVLGKVDLWGYVQGLPLGMHTVIGAHGSSQLPTGLSYNLNLARAYVKDTSIMLIDEMPYAFLNSAAGEYFKDMIMAWKGHKTVVMVTHREDYLALADMAVLLRSGQAALVNTPEAIIRTIYDSQEAAYA